LKQLYGTLPSSAFPFDTKDLWILFDFALLAAKVSGIPSPADCPTTPYSRYLVGCLYQPVAVSWIWHAYPYNAIPAKTWIEVIHERDPFGDEGHGMWFQYAPGSGVWFNTGATKAFNDHSDAYSYFKLGNCGSACNSDVSVAAAGAGYDSIQFVNHIDHVSYPCDTKNTGLQGFQYMGLEVVAVKNVGTFACGTAAGAPPNIGSGWQGSQPCNCDATQQFINCNGIPTLERTVLNGSAAEAPAVLLV
jgi:hypothetical protein